MSKIIQFKKPDKLDYTNSNAFRPISLFSTLSKAIKVVVAERIRDTVKRYSLLLLNHYGALK